MTKVKSSQFKPDLKPIEDFSHYLRDIFLGQPVRLLSLMLVLLAVVQAWSYSQRLVCIDYYQFWIIGQAKRTMPLGNIYLRNERERIGKAMFENAEALVGPSAEARASSKQFQVARRIRKPQTTSTPWLYTVFGLFASGNYGSDQDRYQYFSLFCLLFAVFSIGRILKYLPAAVALAAVVFLNWFAPTTSDTNVGNVARFQLALLALVLWMLSRRKWPGRYLASGFVLGCAILFKPNLAYVALILCLGWLLFRQWRKLLFAVAGMAVGCMVSVLISCWYFGSFRPWLNWAQRVPQLIGGYESASAVGDFSPGSIMEGYFGFSETGYLPLLCLVALGILLSFLWMRGGKPRTFGVEEEANILLLSLGAVVSLLASGLAWLHYFVLTIPMALFLLRPIHDGAATGWKKLCRGLAALAIVMIALEPFKSLFHIAETDAKSALLISGGTLLILVLALCEFLLLCRAEASATA